MNILLTGSASHLAKVLLPQLCNHDGIKSIIGIDLKKSHFFHPKFKEIIADIRDKNLEKHFENVDQVIHLAFIVLRSNLKKQRKNRTLIYDINVNGSLNIINLANIAKIKKFIHMSSAVVYGPQSYSNATYCENTSRQNFTNFAYAEDKNTVEDEIEKIETTSNMQFIRFRPHVIVGHHCQPFLRHLIKQPFYPKLPNPQPLIQCVWENDVAQAIILALFSNAEGTFNLAANNPVSFKDIIRLNKIALSIPHPLIKVLHNFSWKLTGIFEEPGWLNATQHSLILNTNKATKVLKWRPSIDAITCIKQTREHF